MDKRIRKQNNPRTKDTITKGLCKYTRESLPVPIINITNEKVYNYIIIKYYYLLRLFYEYSIILNVGLIILYYDDN